MWIWFGYWFGIGRVCLPVWVTRFWTMDGQGRKRSGEEREVGSLFGGAETRGQLQNSQFVIVGKKSTIGFRVLAIAIDIRNERCVTYMRGVGALFFFSYTHIFFFFCNVRKASGIF